MAKVSFLIDLRSIRAERSDFLNNAKSVGILPTALRQRIEHPQKGVCEIVGFNVDAPVRPIILRRVSDNRMYRVRPELVRNCLPKELRSRKPRSDKGVARKANVEAQVA